MRSSPKHEPPGLPGPPLPLPTRGTCFQRKKALQVSGQGSGVYEPKLPQAAGSYSFQEGIMLMNIYMLHEGCRLAWPHIAPLIYSSECDDSLFSLLREEPPTIPAIPWLCAALFRKRGPVLLNRMLGTVFINHEKRVTGIALTKRPAAPFAYALKTDSSLDSDPCKTPKTVIYRPVTCDPLSKLLVSPLITPIVVPYIIPYITPFKEFRLWLM